MQGLLRNTPSIVPLVSLKRIRVTTQIERQLTNFFWQIMALPMENVYKQILVMRSIDIETSVNTKVGKGPVDIMLSTINKYGLIDEVKQVFRLRGDNANR